jgi:hypothetical protein
MRRLMRQLFILIVLVVSLIILTSNQSGKAVTCCSTCDANFEHCLNNCHGIPSCNDRCYLYYDNCSLTCNPDC